MTSQKNIFHWQGTNSNGERLKGEIPAASLNLARYYLQKKNIQPSLIQQKNLTYFQHRIASRDITIFFRQLTTLLNAGIPITQAVSLLSLNCKNEKLSAMLSFIREDLNRGKNLSDILRKFPDFFDTIICSLIAAGEKTGTMENMLEQVILYREKSALVKNKIFQALFYPGIIVSIAIITTIIMLTCIVPRFADLFQSMRTPLPAFTMFVIHIARFFQHFQYFFLILVCAGCGLFFFLKKRAHYKRTFDAWIISLPIAGIALRKIIFIRFTRSFATIFGSGIPMTDALHILQHCTGNLIFADTIQQLYLAISTGKQLHVAMQKFSIFPDMMIQMIQIGEESGTLEKMLHKIADFYEGDIDYLIANLNKLLEPLIMIILGVLIGGLVIAMYLPIFKLGTVI